MVFFAIFKPAQGKALTGILGGLRRPVFLKRRKTMKQNETITSYATYLKSNHWRARQRSFLKKSKGRCALFPWLRVGKVGGKYYRYACHHMHYGCLGDERWRRDVVILSHFAHDQVIHGLLSGWKRPQQQRVYPNFWQRLAHAWCQFTTLF